MNIFAIFGYLFENLVYRPQLNLLQFYFKMTGDIGLAIVLVGLSVNLILWPLVLSNYISSYKMKILAPEIKKIQEKYKLPKDAKATEVLANNGKMSLEMREFNKKHNVNNAVTFQILFMQLFFGSGLFYIINDISKNNGKITGLYEFLFGSNETNFPKVAFGGLQIDVPVSNYIWLPILIFALSVIYGYYSIKLAPQIKLPIFAKMKQEADRIKQLEKDKKAGKITQVSTDLNQQNEEKSTQNTEQSIDKNGLSKLNQNITEVEIVKTDLKTNLENNLHNHSNKSKKQKKLDKQEKILALVQNGDKINQISTENSDKKDQKINQTKNDINKEIQTQKEEEKAEEPIFDMESFQKTQEMNIIYLVPLISLLANIGWSTGLNIYFLTLNIFNLLRQIAIVEFYHNHINTLAGQIQDELDFENKKPL